MKVLLFIMSIAVSGMSFASPGNNGFGIKEIPEKNILVVHYNAQRHIAIYFGELVAYYNKSKTPFEVVFPQITIEYSQYNK